MNHRFLIVTSNGSWDKGFTAHFIPLLSFLQDFCVLVEYTIYKSSLDIAHRALFRLNEG